MLWHQFVITPHSVSAPTVLASSTTAIPQSVIVMIMMMIMTMIMMRIVMIMKRNIMTTIVTLYHLQHIHGEGNNIHNDNDCLDRYIIVKIHNSK